MKFTLHKFIRGDVQKTCLISAPNGAGYMNALYTFKPGEVYETNDPIFAAYISYNNMGDVREHSPYTPDLKDTLEAFGVPYESRKCGSCTGAKPQLWYNPFHVLTPEEEKEYE